MGKLIIFSAPSGSGKSTIINYLLTQELNLAFSISATSRPPRGTEQNGVEYFFLSPDEFRAPERHHPGAGSPNCSKLVLDMLRVAKEKGLTVSFDGNFRSMLWSWEEARDFCTAVPALCRYAAGHRAVPPLARRERPQSKGDCEGRRAAAAQL